MKTRCFWTAVLENTLESPLDCKDIKPVNPKGNQTWIFTGRTDAEAPIFWLLGAKSWFTGKDPYAGKDGRQQEKETTEDEMVGWYHQLNGHEFEQAPGDSEGKGSLACCSPVQFSSVAQSCLTLCDPMDHSIPGLPVHHQLPDFTQTHVHEF